MELITKREQLPPMPKTHAHTLYKGGVPVIVFSLEEHREYQRLRGGDRGWQGWQAARETARAHFEANAECQHIEIIFMNDEGAPEEAAYGGRLLRSQFEAGGKYAPGMRAAKGERGN